jgi:hypothetical protein
LPRLVALRRGQGARLVASGLARRLHLHLKLGPGFSLSSDLRSSIPGVEDSAQCVDARPGDRAGIRGNQSQRHLAGLYQDEPQRLHRYRHDRAGCPRGGTCRLAGSGQSDRNVHALGKLNHSLVMQPRDWVEGIDGSDCVQWKGRSVLANVDATPRRYSPVGECRDDRRGIGIGRNTRRAGRAVRTAMR